MTHLDRYGGRIRRLDVHLCDAVGHKTSHEDKRCVIEARRDGHEFIKVTRSYSLGCVAPVKNRRLFDVLGKGARWRVLCGMS